MHRMPAINVVVRSWAMLGVCMAVLSATAVPSHTQQQHPSQAEYAIYSVVLDSLYSSSAEDAYLVADSTARGGGRFGVAGYELLEAAFAEVPDLPVGIVASFETRNAHPLPLRSECFKTTLPVKLLGSLGDAAGRRIHEESADWNGFPSDYPARGVVTLSRAGIGPNGEYALVNVQFDCGGRCGGQWVVLLANQGEGWTIRRTEQVVVY